MKKHVNVVVGHGGRGSPARKNGRTRRFAPTTGAFFLILLFCVTIFANNQQRIAVYMAGEEPHSAQGAHSVLGGELARAISRSDRYSAVDRTDVIQRQLAREHQFQRGGAVSDEQIRALGQQFGVQYLCIAEISALRGGSYYLDVRLVDVVTAEIVNTVTANSDLRDGNEMMRVARQIARELIGGDTEPAVSLPQSLRATEKLSFWTGVCLEIFGAGLLAYGLNENNNVKNSENRTSAEKSARNRNIGYILGGAFLLGGVSIQILF